MKQHLLLMCMFLLASWGTMGQTPVISDLTLTPALDITHFDNYNLSVEVDPNGTTVNSVSFKVLPQRAGTSNTNWDFFTNGTPNPNPNVELVEEATNTSGNSWSFSQLRPDNIYSEIAFIFDINSAPSNSRFWQDSYQLLHFTNNFEITANTNFFIEIYATPNSGAPPSADMQVYLVGKDFNIGAFESGGALANEAWQNHASVELVGTINRDNSFHHTHGENSKHFLVPLSADANSKIGNKDLDISGDFWIILTTGHQLQTRGWDMKYHSGDNNGTWYKGSGTTFTQQTGCPDVHVHFAREGVPETIDVDRDAMKVQVAVNYNSGSTLESNYTNYYFAELPNLAPNASAFTAPAAGSYSGDVTISWQPATDPNNDALTYKIYLIDTNGNPVTPAVATGLTGTSYTFNTTTFPNGDYDIMVEAYDGEFYTDFYWSSGQDEDAKITFSTDWTGGASGDETNWANAANWSSVSIPDVDSWIRIPVAANTPIIGSVTTAICNNLVIESGGELLIESGGALSIEGTLDNSGTVTVNSNASANGSLILTGTLTGNVTYNRYLMNDQWHLVSSPVIGQSYNSDFFAENSIDHNPDLTEFALIDYDTENNQWNLYPGTDASWPFTSAKGFLMARYIDSSAGGTVNFTGTIATSDVSFTPSTAGYRWNAVGNPFPSAIGINSNAGTNNFIDANPSNLDPSFTAIYYWDDTAGGNYFAINQSSDAFYAAPGQGFFVKAASSASTISFPAALRTHQGAVALKSGQAEWPQLELVAKSGDARSVATIKFIDETTPGLDVGYDAGKFKSNPEMNLFTKLVDDNGVDFGLQCLPPTEMESLTIPVGLDVKSAGEITFSINFTSLPENRIPVLEDRLLNIKIPFITGSVTYTSAVNESESDYGRFYISFSSTTDATQIQNATVFKAWYSNNTIHIQGKVEGAATITLYDMNGRALMQQEVRDESQNSLSIPNFENGIYLVKIAGSNKTELLKVPVLK